LTDRYKQQQQQQLSNNSNITECFLIFTKHKTQNTKVPSTLISSWPNDMRRYPRRSHLQRPDTALSRLLFTARYEESQCGINLATVAVSIEFCSWSFHRRGHGVSRRQCLRRRESVFNDTIVYVGEGRGGANADDAF
jgi:hypothetical protein